MDDGHPAPRRSATRLVRVAAAVALFAAVGGVFVIPWRAIQDDLEDLPVTRYTAFKDGNATLVRHTDPGEVVSWESIATGMLPGLRALADLPNDFETAVMNHVGGGMTAGGGTTAGPDELRRARVGLISRRELRSDGSTTTTTELQVLDHRGLFLLGSQAAAASAPTMFEPAVMLLPADPRPRARWSTDGQIGGVPYRWRAEITHTGSLDTGFGRMDDCVTVEAALSRDETDEPIGYVDQYCAGVGWVSGEVEGTTRRVSETVSASGRRAQDLPEGLAGGDPRPVPAGGRPGDWVLTRTGSALPLTLASAATFPPVYLPTDPPAILVATEAGSELVALATDGVSGGVQWRMPIAGAAYAAPRYDAGTGRIYVGATDGVLRALDARGLFLWSVAVGDNIATRPVVVDGTVVFGSEDGKVYGVDAGTGERRWRLEVDGAVVSSPVEVAGLVAIADESGVVHALDPANGRERWTHDVAASVEAPLGAAPGGLLVADRSGALTLLNEAGETLWVADVGGGAAVLTEPTVGGGQVVTVDRDGDMATTSLEDGDVRWRRLDESYSGSPTITDGAIVAARRDGTIDALDDDGGLVRRFDVRKAMAPTDWEPGFTYGPAAGGGALWLIDDRGIVRRLAEPNEEDPSRLQMAWAKTFLDRPFAGEPFMVSPAPWGDRLVLIDRGRNLYVVDPETGEASRTATIGAGGGGVLPDIVVDDDIVLVDTTDRLVAVDLTTGAEQWSSPLSGIRFHPPVVADDTAVIVTDDGSGMAIVGIDMASGGVRWTRPSGPGAAAVGPVLMNDLVLAGDPVSALDPATGEVAWTSSVSSVQGRPVVTGGAVVVATAADGGAGGGGLAAIDSRSGATVWERSTPGDLMGPTGRLVASRETVVVPSLSGAVMGVDAATGEERWRWHPPEPTIGNPSQVGDRAWFALRSGQVVAIDADDGTPTSVIGALATDIDMVGAVQRPIDTGHVVVVAAGTLVFGVEEPSP